MRQLIFSGAAAHETTLRVRQPGISEADAHKTTLRVRQLGILHPGAHSIYYLFNKLNSSDNNSNPFLLEAVSG